MIHCRHRASQTLQQQRQQPTCYSIAATPSATPSAAAVAVGVAIAVFTRQGVNYLSCGIILSTATRRSSSTAAAGAEGKEGTFKTRGRRRRRHLREHIPFSPCSIDLGTTQHLVSKVLQTLLKQSTQELFLQVQQPTGNRGSRVLPRVLQRNLPCTANAPVNNVISSCSFPLTAADFHILEPS